MCIGIHIDDSAKEFKRATRTNLDDLYANAVDELPQFFKLKDDIFKVDEEGMVMLHHSSEGPKSFSKGGYVQPKEGAKPRRGPKKPAQTPSSKPASGVTSGDVIVID